MNIKKANHKQRFKYARSKVFRKFLSLTLVAVMVFGYTNFINNNASIAKNLSDDHTTFDIQKSTQYMPENLTKTKASPIIDLKEAVIDKVLVDKSEQKLHLMDNGNIIKSYHIALGDNPKGHKQQQGDERTPEGVYVLDYKNENSIAHRSIHVSYPNKFDKAHANSLGVDVGGDIMIHGQMNGYGDLAAQTQLTNWTDGCIAVTDKEMDEIMEAVKVGTPIEITW